MIINQIMSGLMVVSTFVLACIFCKGRFFRMLTIWACVLLTEFNFIALSMGFLLNHNDPLQYYKAAVINHLMHNTPLDHYQQDNEQIAELEEKIYRDYGIRVYSNVNLEELYGRKDIEADTVLRDEQILVYLHNIDVCLSMYTDRALLSVPKLFFLNNYVRDKGKIVSGVNCGSFIVFNATWHEKKTIHHELFHSIEEQMGIRRYNRFRDDAEACELTSDYSCKSTREHLAEAWSRGIEEGLDNSHVRILKELYPVLLKSESNGEDWLSLLISSVKKVSASIVE